MTRPTTKPVPTEEAKAEELPERKPYEVIVDDHTHQGKPVLKGSTIYLYDPQGKALLETNRVKRA